MIDVHFVILGAAISLIGQGFYVRDTLLGRTYPNRVTWLLWAIAPLLAFAVEVQDGVGLRALMTLSIGIGPLAVVIASFVSHKAVWRIGPLDWVCGALSVVGTALWLITRNGEFAIWLAIAADFLAGLPTLVKSWQAPETESAAAYIGAFINAVLTLLTVTTVTLAIVAFPAYIAVVSSIEVLLVAGRLGPRVRHLRRAGPQTATTTSVGTQSAIT